MNARGVVLLAVLAMLVVHAPVAQARVALVATGTPELALLDVSSDRVAARIGLPAPSMAVAVTSDGTRGFVAAGATVVAIDVNERTEITRRTGGSAAIAGLAVAPDGRRLYAVQGERLRVLRADTLAPAGSVALRGRGRAVALGRDGSLAAVVLAGGRVAIVDAREQRLLRRVSVPGATGVAVAPDGTTFVSACGSLRIIARGARAGGGSGCRAARAATLRCRPDARAWPWVRAAAGAAARSSSCAAAVCGGCPPAAVGWARRPGRPTPTACSSPTGARGRSRSSARSHARCWTSCGWRDRRRAGSSCSPAWR